MPCTNDPACRHFRDNINSYNSALSFAACIHGRDDRPEVQTGLRPYVARGEVYLSTFLLQRESDADQHAWVYDPQGASGVSFESGGVRLREPIARNLAAVLCECGHPLLGFYLTAKEQLAPFATIRCPNDPSAFATSGCTRTRSRRS